MDHSAKGNSATQISTVCGTFVVQTIPLLVLLVHKSLLCHLCICSLGSPCSPRLMSMVHARRAIALKEAMVSLCALDILGLHAESSPQRSLGTQTAELGSLWLLPLAGSAPLPCCPSSLPLSLEQLQGLQGGAAYLLATAAIPERPPYPPSGMQVFQPCPPSLTWGKAESKSNCIGDLLPHREF